MSPTVTGFSPNSLNRIAEPWRTKTSLTHSSARGSTGRWMDRVLARTGDRRGGDSATVGLGVVFMRHPWAEVADTHQFRVWCGSVRRVRAPTGRRSGAAVR